MWDPRKKWRELIQKVWETDPFICPQCAHLMRISGLLEDREAAASLLNTLGWLGYFTDSRGARAPPPLNDPNVPELPFTCDGGGIVYEPEPWELARQQRLERYARQRDQIAGIVVYDGERTAEMEEDFCPQTALENQAEVFPEAFDQRLPEAWHDSQWDQTAEQWQETPLALWATVANFWDSTDPIPTENEPVFFSD
jgi:hypothetical protein